MEHILSGRLRALTDAHSLVRRTFDGVGSASQGAELDKLVQAILLPHESAEQDQFNIVGPSIWLGAHATNGFALVLHEMATNAAKYGALKTSGGSVHVHWQKKNGHLSLTWEESGGPEIDGAPATSGFGSTLTKSTVVGQLGGQLAYDWRPEGLSVTMSVPIENLAG